MGSRDHSATCETCGLDRGGLNNLLCDCDIAATGERITTSIVADLQAATVECEALRSALARVAAERDEAFARGRTVGREDVGKYSNAIGLIESAVGIAGAKPLAETVRAVQALVVQRDTALAAAEKMRGVYEAAVRWQAWCVIVKNRPTYSNCCHRDEALVALRNAIDAATSGGDEGEK